MDSNSPASRFDVEAGQRVKLQQIHNKIIKNDMK